MGIGMLLAGLSGAGNATANVARDYQRTADEEAAAARRFDQSVALDRLRTELNVEQAARIAENQRAAAEAPARSFSALLSKYAGEELPVYPEPITNLSGAGLPSGNPGFHGDPDKARAEILALADPELRALGLRQLDQQLAEDEMIAARAAEGMTVRRTDEEALAAALADAKMNDPTAYMAGKAMGEDKYMQISANGSVLDKTTGKVIFQNPAGMDAARLAAETKLAIAEANNASREEIAELRAKVKAAGNGNTPSIVSTANWLIEQGIAKTPGEAWAMAKTGAAKADSDNIVKIAGILAQQPGYKATSNTGKGKAADLFADAAALANGIGSADLPPSAAPAPAAAPAGSTPYPIDGLPAGAELQKQYLPKQVYKLPNGQLVEKRY